MSTVTIDEGFGTIYDRVWKARILLQLCKEYNLNSITEYDTGVPILESGGVGLDILILHKLFDPIQIVYLNPTNRDYARKFFSMHNREVNFVSRSNFAKDVGFSTDILFGNYILEFLHPQELIDFLAIAKKKCRYMVFFESNHNNLGHKLVKLVGRRFMIAPWVSYRSMRETTPEFSVNLLNLNGAKVVKYGMIDFPFFAPASGVSPFKSLRTERDNFELSELGHLKKSMIKGGMRLESIMPHFVRKQSHMFYVVCKGEFS
jgi:hypothetical protein